MVHRDPLMTLETERFWSDMRGVLKDGIYTKSEDEKQKLRMGGGSWSINLDELPAEATVIEYVTAIDRYTITKEDALRYGFMRMLGGEKKLVVPLSRWQKGAVAISE